MDEDRHFLLVDADHDYLNWAEKHLDAEGIRILKCDDAAKALKVAQKVDVELVIADLALQPFDGVDLLKQLKAHNPETLVILTSSFPNAAQIVQATQQGAHDILKKESLTFELRGAVENAWQIIDGRKNAENETSSLSKLQSGKSQVIGISKAFQDVFKLVGRVARTDAPVLVTGESGTGKEVVARSIHEYSPRRQNEMVALNCGAIPENLLESELFGHEKGAFTGAASRRSGRFEQCDQSTLFLDEIGDMPLSVQVKLLRVLQEGTFSRVGGNETLSSDVRIIAATNKNLAQEVAEGRFREDLYYRLNVVELKLPPLRERVEDIPLLAEFFLRKITRKNGMARIRLSDEAMHKLQQQRWTGNVRELENTMARACALAASPILLADDIPLTESMERKQDVQRIITSLLANAPEGENALLWAQRRMAEKALTEAEGDATAAAKILHCTVKELNQLLAD